MDLPERFRLIEVLSETRCTAEDLTTGRIVVVKRPELDHNGVSYCTIREIALLRDMCHPNVIKLLDVVDNGSGLYIVFEGIHRSLESCLSTRTDPFDGPQLASLSLQVILGLHCLQSCNILHRNLKPKHLFMSSDDTVVKLGDFPWARCFTDKTRTYTNQMVTFWYRAPELLLGEIRHSPGVDIWSAACVIAELATKRVLFRGDSEIDQIFKIFQLLGTPTELTWPYLTNLPEFQETFPKWAVTDLADSALFAVDPLCVDLITRMLTYNPAERITLTEAIWHPFFDGVRAELIGGDGGEAMGCPRVRRKKYTFTPPK